MIVIRALAVLIGVGLNALNPADPMGARGATVIRLNANGPEWRDLAGQRATAIFRRRAVLRVVRVGIPNPQNR